MKKRSLDTLLIVSLFSIFLGCKKTDIYHSDALADYLQLQVGKYITYRLDSLVFINFGTGDTVISYLAKDVIDDSISDNLGRPSWRVIRYLSDTTGTLPWTPTETYMITATRQSVEVVENNLRFIKLELPIVNGFSWPGNSYIDVSSYLSPFTYLKGWNYTYDSVGMPYMVSGTMIPNSVIVHQRDSTGDNSTSQQPVAVTGPSKTITFPINSVQLDGSQSMDPNGFLTGYNWKQLSGPSNATIVDSSAPTTTANNLQAGQYIFQLTVIDNDSLVDATQMKVIVAPSGNILPVANAGGNQFITLPVNSITVDGSGSITPSGTITKYSWTMASGPAPATIASPNSAVTKITGLIQGIYTFTLQVTDSNGGSSSDNVSVVVGEPSFSERDFSVEVYGKGIGLIYKNFIHKEYQAPNVSTPVGSFTGFGITLSMVDHN
ncbi:MAG: hypothetical protein C5B59_04660 [Bacteroidetes bacterium]|nr:MAG: hypothetical protein C5B59_04660 [Bacteroidota bacterium]